MPVSTGRAARVATFNLLHGVRLADGATDPADLDVVAHTLDADLLGLQEVDRRQARSRGVDQAAAVAHALGARAWRFAPAVHGTPGERWTPATEDDGSATTGPTYGVALVSRWPVRRWWVRRFAPAPVGLPLLVPQPPRARLVRVADEPRVALAALVDGPAGPFTAVTCHLSFVPGYNVRQLRTLARWVARMPPPVLLLGDLNLPGTLPSRLTGWASLARAATYPSYAPRVQFDHVLGLGIDLAAVQNAEAVRLPVSDHLALTVHLDLSGPVGGPTFLRSSAPA